MHKPDIKALLGQLGKKGVLFYGFCSLAVLLFLSRWVAFVRYKAFDIDEFEHVHSAWYILKGYLPYKDFFQHHPPLMWYSILPVLAMGHESANLLIPLRYIQFFIGLMLLLLVFFAALTITRSRWMGLLAVLLLFSVGPFVENVIEIRPDGWQVLFGMAAIFLLTLFWQWKRTWLFVLSGSFMMISFLYFQKSIFLFPVFAGLILWGRFRGEITWKQVLWFVLAAALPLAVFAGCIAYAGMWREYYALNFGLNLVPLGSKVHMFMHTDWYVNVLFWICSVVAAVYCVWQRERKVHSIGWFMLAQSALLIYAQRFAPQYYIFAAVLGSLCIALMVHGVFGKWKLDFDWKPAVVILIGLWSYWIFWHERIPLNHEQLQKAQYVLDHTTAEDRVLDGNNQFNLFRKDVHYVWFSFNRGLEILQKKYGKYRDFSRLELVRKYRPKFVMKSMVLWERDESLAKQYVPTPFSNLVMRKDDTDQ